MTLLISFLINDMPLNLMEKILFEDFFEDMNQIEFLWEKKDEFFFWLHHFDDLFRQGDLIQNVAPIYAEKIIEKHQNTIEDGFGYKSKLTQLSRFTKQKIEDKKLMKYLRKHIAYALLEEDLLEQNASLQKLLSEKNFSKDIKDFYQNTQFGYFTGNPQIILKQDAFLVETTYRLTSPHDFYYQTRGQFKTNYVSHIYNIVQPVVELIITSNFLFIHNVLPSRPIVVIIKFLDSSHQKIAQYTDLLDGLLSSLLSIISDKFNSLIMYEYTIDKDKSEQDDFWEGIRELYQEEGKNQGHEESSESNFEPAHAFLVAPKKINLQDTEQILRQVLQVIKEQNATLVEAIKSEQQLDLAAKSHIFPKVSEKIDLNEFNSIWTIFKIRQEIYRMLHYPDPHNKRGQVNHNTRKKRKLDQNMQNKGEEIAEDDESDEDNEEERKSGQENQQCQRKNEKNKKNETSIITLKKDCNQREEEQSEEKRKKENRSQQIVPILREPIFKLNQSKKIQGNTQNQQIGLKNDQPEQRPPQIQPQPEKVSNNQK